VLVLDPALIPTSVDVVIGDNVYELHFKVEPEEMQDSPRLLEMDDDNDEVIEKKMKVQGKRGGGGVETTCMQEDDARSSDSLVPNLTSPPSQIGSQLVKRATTKWITLWYTLSMMDDALV
jgi:hypothetical protein